MAKESKKNALLERIKKNSTLDNISVLSESKLFADKESEHILTDVPLINAALSGDMDKGMIPGFFQIVGGSRMFKSGFMLLMIRAFQKTYPDGVVLFYDSEFGSPESYFDAFEINKDNVLHCPITNVEELKFDLAQQLDGIEDGDKVFIAVDSIGSLASKKEAEDALEGKSVADMTRAKQINSLSRIVAPHLVMKSLYMVVINHGYKEQGLFPKTIVGGGEKIFLISDNVWIIGRQQEKEGDEVVGHTFMIKIEKSRYAREKIVIPITVTHNGGLDRYSGLLDLAIECGMVKQVQAKPKAFARVDLSTGEIKEEAVKWADTSTHEFWKDILADETFKEFIRTKFKVAYMQLIGDYESTEATENE